MYACCQCCPTGFNPRAHGGGRDMVVTGPMAQMVRFNPRAHGGRDMYVCGNGLQQHVSIHAPTGDATCMCAEMVYNNMFQSTRPRGTRLAIAYCLAIIFKVSIHAPTGDATHHFHPCIHQGPCFNPRAHGGRDASPAAVPSEPDRFNPRAHGGRDPTCVFFSVPPTVFQSTRPRGTRPGRLSMMAFTVSFQSTRPRGTRQEDVAVKYVNPVFQSTRPRGTRLIDFYL